MSRSHRRFHSYLAGDVTHEILLRVPYHVWEEVLLQKQIVPFRGLMCEPARLSEYTPIIVKLFEYPCAEELEEFLNQFGRIVEIEFAKILCAVDAFLE